MIPLLQACSCVWKGLFFRFTGRALVVIGKIIRHHPGKSPTMDVLVLERSRAAFWIREWLSDGRRNVLPADSGCFPPA